MEPSSTAFGSSDVARKTTACIACHKRKVRCHMTNERPPCTRCRNRGLECTFNKSVRTLLQDDTEWKHGIEERIEIIERSLATSSALTTACTMEDVTHVRQDLNVPVKSATLPSLQQDDNANTGLNLSCSLSSFPASFINGATQNDSPRVYSSLNSSAGNLTGPASHQQSLLASSTAEEHIRFYHTYLDPMVHYVLAGGESISSIRLRSEFLVVAVCTVAAYCASTNDYNEWLEQFKALVVARTFSKHHAFDDVRALCIGALWLSDLATTLSALALVSQVDFWNTNAKVFDTFGADIEGLNSSFVNSINRLNICYDEWHKDWQPILSPLSRLIGNKWQNPMNFSHTNGQIPNLYLHAAKLQLFANVFRGPSQRASQPPVTLDPHVEFKRFGSFAIKNALDYLDLLNSAVVSGLSFGTLPAYLATMTAFSSVFLLRISMSQQNVIASEHDKDQYFHTVEHLCEVLRKETVKSTAHSANNSTSQSLASKIDNALETAKEIKTGNTIDSNKVKSQHPRAMESQGSHVYSHSPHEVFDASAMDVFDIEVPMNFDFSFMDYDTFVWDNTGEQGGYIHVTDSTTPNGI